MGNGTFVSEQWEEVEELDSVVKFDDVIILSVLLFVGYMAIDAVFHSLCDFAPHHLDLISCLCQTAWYVITLFVVINLFSARWRTGFFRGASWNIVGLRNWGLTIVLSCLVVDLTLFIAILSVFKVPKGTGNDVLHWTGAVWVDMLGATIVAPFFEELAFRGFLQPGNYQALRKKTDTRVAFSITAVLVSISFALLHYHEYKSWPIVEAIFVSSLIMCAIRHYRKSLAASVLFHALGNACP
jgi:membrane protease YdiL (CAAX protease family)